MVLALESAPAQAQAPDCAAAVTNIVKTLRLNPKDVQTACARAKGKPALASRNFLGRFVKVAKLK